MIFSKNYKYYLSLVSKISDKKMMDNYLADLLALNNFENYCSTNVALIEEDGNIKAELFTLHDMLCERLEDLLKRCTVEHEDQPKNEPASKAK
ncbi:MAG: hypothetical protein Ta2B_28850 [Termitinemataceae bacterium]|nr:MAG: hypothetical protein Ta2B_28850 [Termitinemataceae bacterium]